jgi:hypothetical protein
MVQHENSADACEDWSQQIMRTGEVKGLQPGAYDGVTKHFHQGVAACWSTFPT